VQKLSPARTRQHVLLPAHHAACTTTHMLASTCWRAAVLPAPRRGRAARRYTCNIGVLLLNKQLLTNTGIK
jgi:hypothetical protein